ncbi:MAG: restriction endonuclease subunit S [Acidaminococcaceae bacterium]|nr:restriction endonuclease subunit S [Acidaminococcaceae bacterium]
MIDTQALRQKVLDLAIRGKLTEQLPEDGTAEELYAKIQEEKQTLIKEGKIKKEKPLPPIAEDEIPFEIPANWKWVRIGSVFTLKAGKNIAASLIHDIESEDYCYPCFGGNGLRGYVNQTNVSGLHALIGRQGALCGNINFADGDFYATEHAIVVNEYSEKTDTKWSGLTLKTLNLNQYATSVAQPGLAVNKIEKIVMPLPPLAEQKRIVEKIESIFVVLDKIDLLQSEYVNNLSALKTKIIEAGIQGKLTEQLPEDGTAEELFEKIQEEKQSLIKEGKIKKEKLLPPITEDEIPFAVPENWKWVRLGTAITLISGVDFNSDEYNDEGRGIPYITGASNFLNDGILVNRWTETPQHIANEGDVLLVCKGSGYGKTAMCNIKTAHIARQVMAVKKTEMLSMKFVLFFLKSCFNYLKSKGQGLIPGIDRSSVLNIAIPLPPLAEQKRIVAKLDAVLAILHPRH